MENFKYTDEHFADIQMLRYRLNGFDSLTLRQKKLVYYLSQAALCGRDITFDQFGKYNLRIRKMLEAVYTGFKGSRDSQTSRLLRFILNAYGSQAEYIITTDVRSLFRSFRSSF